MFVYGIRCAPADLLALATRLQSGNTNADYYMDYGMLVFPQYTRPSIIQAHTGLTPAFWSRVRRIVETPGRPHTVDLEHPWITDEQADVVRIIKEAYPTADTDWYYVPAVANAVAAQG
jgi:hypothetical protein